MSLASFRVCCFQSFPEGRQLEFGERLLHQRLIDSPLCPSLPVLRSTFDQIEDAIWFRIMITLRRYVRSQLHPLDESARFFVPQTEFMCRFFMDFPVLIQLSWDRMVMMRIDTTMMMVQMFQIQFRIHPSFYCDVRQFGW